MNRYSDLWVCVDCYGVYHYGLSQWEVPEDWDVDTVNSFYDQHGFQNITDNADDEDGHIEFSKSPCDMCKSHLAGSRERLALHEERVS